MGGGRGLGLTALTQSLFSFVPQKSHSQVGLARWVATKSKVDTSLDYRELPKLPVTDVKKSILKKLFSKIKKIHQDIVRFPFLNLWSFPSSPRSPNGDGNIRGHAYYFSSTRAELISIRIFPIFCSLIFETRL